MVLVVPGVVVVLAVAAVQFRRIELYVAVATASLRAPFGLTEGRDFLATDTGAAPGERVEERRIRGRCLLILLKNLTWNLLPRGSRALWDD